MVTEVQSVRVLTAEDRCTRCGAQAYVKTQHESGTLLWCAHHAKVHAAAIADYIVVDERHALA